MGGAKHHPSLMQDLGDIFGNDGTIKYFAIGSDRFGDDLILIDIKSHETKLGAYKSGLWRSPKFV